MRITLSILALCLLTGCLRTLQPDGERPSPAWRQHDPYKNMKPTPGSTNDTNAIVTP